MGQKVWNAIAATGLVLSGLISLTPFKLAPVCTKLLQLSSGMMVPMKCNWSGRAEVIMGIVVMAASLLIFLMKKEGGKKALGIMLGILGIAILTIPTKLGIGICANPHMACHTTAKFLDLWGAGLIILGAVALFTSQEQEKPVS